MDKIDIEDINYITSHEELNLPNLKNQYNANFFLLLSRWAYVILKGLSGIPSLFYNYYKDLRKTKFAFFAFSRNNERSIGPIKSQLPDSILFSLENPLPLKRIRFFSMVYSPFVVMKYFTKKGYMKRAYCSDFVNYCNSYGYYVEAKNILKTIEPKVIILSNDHVYMPRAFLRAAQKLKIKTVYVQHASVTENFPSLEFDYAFLDGMQSYEKYTANNKPLKSTVFLSGNPRFDVINDYTGIKRTDDGVKCGIAINTLDNVNKVETLLELLKSKDITITLRPHPAMEEGLWQKIAMNNDCSISNSKEESPFEFINKNDIFISGESSFHLDVLLFGKTSYYYNFEDTGQILDWYGYISQGIIKNITDLSGEELIRTVSTINYPECSKVSYYVANFQTTYWCKGADLIATTLSDLIDNKPLETWTKVDGNLFMIKIR